MKDKIGNKLICLKFFYKGFHFKLNMLNLLFRKNFAVQLVYKLVF
jgi:hypothetical protein